LNVSSIDKFVNGIENLTPSGARQHFLIGTQVRRKYIEEQSFLSPVYNPDEIYV